MAAPKQKIIQWIVDGIEQKASHLLVFCDTFDYTDYPKYTTSLEEALEMARPFKDSQPNMQRLMEVYNLNGNIEEQLVKPRASIFDPVSRTTLP